MKNTKGVWYRIFLLFLLCTLLDIIISIFNYGMPLIYGTGVVKVMSSSMSASGIEVDDIYVIQSKADYEVGDIIAFNHNGNIWFHEIIAIDPNDTLSFITKGSSNDIPDKQPVRRCDIIGAKTNIKLNFLNNFTLRIILIAIPYMIAMSLMSLQLMYLILPLIHHKK